MNIEQKHTEEFTEITKRIPDNYTTYIIIGLFLFITVFITLSFIIKVPEIVMAEVRITSTRPPTILKSQLVVKSTF